MTEMLRMVRRIGLVLVGVGIGLSYATASLATVQGFADRTRQADRALIVGLILAIVLIVADTVATRTRPKRK